MFYKMIETKRNEWLASETCTVKAVIDYIVKTGQMRDAQVEAIKTYLFLKIACGCKPLAELFCEGAFNTLDLNDLEVSHSTRKYLKENKAAAALFEYACLTNDAGEQVSPKLEQQIRKAPESIDYGKFFRDAFYDLSYTDYLFSLPMGAGKTYLMAAFIYLDLYFARNEPKNSAFAHNFIIFAPSGLKSSVVPSLKTIQNFDPTWVIPEPAASELKRMISFEVLDQSKTAKKSNKTKNPNVQKIANHQPLSELFGLVAVTNAEKVILDRIQESQGQINLFEESDDEKDRQANELRNLIGKLPALSIFIDEVHHAVSDEIKLRAVPLKCSEQPAVGKISIGNISLLLVLKKADNETGCFIRNFFEIDDLVLAGKDDSPEHGTRVSPYVLVTAEQLETIDNADLSEIVPSIQKQPYSAVYGEHIILLILELLKLYDRRKDTTILDVVIQLLDFLSEKDSSQVDLYQINRLQTEKRRRKLNPEEIQYLSSMKTKGIPAQYQLAANILLESFYEAHLIYDRLCPEEKEVFASYPIMNLWKSKD